jgi:hypothetical protein
MRRWGEVPMNLCDLDGIVHEALAMQDGTWQPVCVRRDAMLGRLARRYNDTSLSYGRLSCVRCIVGPQQQRHWL